MAFGPRFIRLTTDLPSLIIIAAGGCLAALAVILSRRRKTVAETCATKEDEKETVE